MFLGLMCLSHFVSAVPDKGISVLLVTGQSNIAHNWRVSHKALAAQLNDAKIFSVNIQSAYSLEKTVESFSPNWSDYDVVLLDYEGPEWSKETEITFETYIESGGGLVLIHAADNAFPHWPAFNNMIGVGGWGNANLHEPKLYPNQPKKQKGRDETSGPRIYWENDHVVRDDSSGGAFHPIKHDFLVTVRAPNHPITKGLPDSWLQGADELYSNLRGPIGNLKVLATGIANPKFAKADRKHEPVVMVSNYGKGRIFHMTLGHVGKADDENTLSMRNASFTTLLSRGTEWAATGSVTQLVPDDFPNAYATSYRPSAITGWDDLLDAKLSKFEKFIGIPHTTVKDLPLNTFQAEDVRTGIPLGLNNDPKAVFSTYQENGKTILAVSGEIYGSLTTTKNYENYHFQAKYRWLNKKWEPRLQKPRDNGILFHSYGKHGDFWHVWKKSLEFQIQENDNGDFITIGGTSAKVPYQSKSGQRGIYDPYKPYLEFQGYLSAYPEPDRPNGNWNTIDLYTFGDKAIYVVNDKVVMSLKDAKNHLGEALRRGQIQIQSEAAEIEYKDVRIRDIDKLPPLLKLKSKL